MAASEVGPHSRTRRPTLRHDSFHGGSFLDDHQQHRPRSTEATMPGILDDASPATGRTTHAAPTDPALSLRPAAAAAAGDEGSAPARSTARIKESGIVHALSHRFCQRAADEPADRLVATIFYKAQEPRHPHVHPDALPRRDPWQPLPAPSLSAGVAPTVEMTKFPLEPPAPEPDPLDHLYGPYVSQVCLTHFLQILDDLQKPWRRVRSWHRCLDDQLHPRVMEVVFGPAPNPEYLSLQDLRRHEALWRFEREWNVDVVVQRDTVWRRHKRLAVFDMDSTLIEQEVIDEIAKVVGVEAEVSAITARAMNGEIDFTASLRARVSLLRGVPADVFEKLKSVITITPGARELCRALRRLGYQMVVISGGFLPLAEWLADELDLDRAYANKLVVSADGSHLTGELEGDIVDGARKAALLEELANEGGIPLKQVIAIGDGANDLLMLHKAGLGVAFNAKPIVQLEAPSRINSESLLDILYILGFTKEDQEALLRESA
ncbi:MAG: hypothetical protein M1826_002920 [Phylliscum demangeonii]|nr:MAG: hypothetical protein M1826_002920 [Phylliscum demangeonii]